MDTDDVDGISAQGCETPTTAQPHRSVEGTV